TNVHSRQEPPFLLICVPNDAGKFDALDSVENFSEQFFKANFSGPVRLLAKNDLTWPTDIHFDVVILPDEFVTSWPTEVRWKA
ncbi:hypothetical protein V3C99_019122, partial [Haemonchus contortus]|uniref:DUF1726 domain-containing protein n=1 Tax=Haemonchus contortus TaxID=6289 RepID=A0A7I4Z2X4_HAECO